MSLLDLAFNAFDRFGDDIFDAIGDLIFTEGEDDIGFIPTGTFGLGGSGWQEKNITKYVKGRKETHKVWYRPYKEMSELEKRAYFQGQRVQAYEARKRTNKAYKRGFNNGAKAQADAERRVESGGTPLVRWSGRGGY